MAFFGKIIRLIIKPYHALLYYAHKQCYFVLTCINVVCVVVCDTTLKLITQFLFLMAEDLEYMAAFIGQVCLSDMSNN